MPRKTTAPNADLRESRSTRSIIGRRIARRRAALGMSQADLAAKFGISRAALSQYEVGIGDLNAGDITFLAQILGVPVPYFFLEEGDENSRERLEQVVAYLPLLPALQQDIIVNTVIDSYGRLCQGRRDILDGPQPYPPFDKDLRKDKAK